MNENLPIIKYYPESNRVEGFGIGLILISELWYKLNENI